MDKPQKAVALKYDRSKDRAPKVVAKGKDLLAEKIIAVAKEHDIPLYEDKNLVQVLDALDVDMDIPPELYRAVAEILVFIYKLNGKL